MMNDPIEREDAIKAIEEAFDMGDCYCDRYGIRGAINAIPVADRPQGEWIEMYRNGFGRMICMCSKCNFQAQRSNFCPNCGAYMKGTDNE